MSDNLGQLERLTKVWRDGGLTDEEFQARKAALLAPPRRLPWAIPVAGAVVVFVGATTAALIWRNTPTPVTANTATKAVPTLTSPVNPAPRVGAPAPTSAEAFAIVYPTAKAAVEWQGQTYHVKFRPEAIYDLGADTFALISVGQNLDESYHAARGFFSVAYFGNYPALAMEGAPFVGVGSQGGWGNPPTTRLLRNISGRPLLEIESSQLGQGETETWADLVVLGATINDVTAVAAGLDLAYDNSGAGTGTVCSIDGRVVPVSKDNSFAIAYRGSYRGRVIYKWQSFQWKRQGSAADLYTFCPQPPSDSANP